MKQFIIWWAAAVLIAASGAYASEGAAPVAAKADPAKAQQIVNTVCIACHGADGNSLLPIYPRLAGQHEAYLTKQLMNFKSAERKNPIMMGMAATLSPEDVRNLAAYFSRQKAVPAPEKDKALAAQGEKIYRGGIMATSVPACSGCHGPTARGIPAQFPRLATQQSDYLETQLKAFRNGERTNDPGKMMQGVAARLTDTEIKAVVEYISSLN